jgi:cell wall-associated NlpC family hydrolase
MKSMKAKSFKQAVAVAVLASSFLYVTPSYASPNTSSALSVQVQDFESKIQQLDNRIIESMEKVKQLNGEIDSQKEKIANIQSEITQSEADFEAHKKIYFGRMRAIQEQGNPMEIYLSVLFESNGFSNFINRSTAVATFVQSDQGLLNTMKEKESDLKKQKQDLEDELLSLQKNKEDLAKEQASIENDKNKVEADLAQAKVQMQQEEARKQTEAQAKAQWSAQSLLRTSPTFSPSISAVDVNTLPVASDKAKAVISKAEQFLGVPYVWGGTTPSGFDCSGLTQFVYRSVGVDLPRVAREQQNAGISISPSQVQPGDLIFIGSPAYHVGIYIGNGKYLHAPHTGDVVKISSYNPSNFTSASRVLR